jgi:hypothetical protein
VGWDVQAWLAQSPTDGGSAEAIRVWLREGASASTYVMAKMVLGYDRLTLRTHAPLCQWIDEEPHRGLAMAPRGSFKSTCLTVAYLIRRVVNDPNVRILLVSGSQENACRFLDIIQQQFRTNETFRALFPEVVPNFQTVTRWNRTEICVPRSARWGEATIEAVGAGGTLVSRHFDHIHNDDLIDEKMAESPAEVARAVNFYKLEESLLVSPKRGTIVTVATPWGFHDPYAWMQKHERGLALYKRGAINPDGSLYFPEELDHAELDRLRDKYGSWHFQCQYLVDPKDPEAMSFDERWLRYYRLDGDRLIPEVGDAVALPDCRVLMRVDPAISEESSAARTAIVVDAVAPDGRKFLLDEWAERCQPLRMFDVIFYLAERWGVESVGVESVAYQRAIKPFLEAEAARRGVYLHIVPLKPDTRKSKRARITAIQPNLERGEIHVQHEHTLFLAEYRDFPHGTTVDVLDAFGYGPADGMWEEPVSALTAEEQAAEDAEWDDTQLWQGRSTTTGY